MIIRRDGQGLLAITQPDHARLAGVFAESWRGGAGGSLVAASHHHDDGWIDWEKAPTVDDHGRPHDFLTIPMDDRVAVYRRGIDLLATTDRAAGLLTSLHFGRLLAEGLPAVEGRPLRPWLSKVPCRRGSVTTLEFGDHGYARTVYQEVGTASAPSSG